MPSWRPHNARILLRPGHSSWVDRYPQAIWLVWIVVNAEPRAMKINFGSARESSVVRIRI
jgi:hypothetical protein